VLATSFFRAGYPIAVIASRTKDHALRLARLVPGARAADQPQEAVDAAEVVFLTVPDDAIAAVAGSLAWRPRKSAVHASGALGLDVLAGPAGQGTSTAVFHPLQTFASLAREEQTLAGSTISILASDEPLRERLREMAQALGARPHDLPADATPLYHASAVLASNALVALVDAAAGLWERFGGSRKEALQSLLPLVQGTVDNLKTIGLPGALTGPVARGDVGTVERHLAALAEAAPEVACAYEELARLMIPIALAKGGLDEAQAGRLREVLDRHASVAPADQRAPKTKGGRVA